MKNIITGRLVSALLLSLVFRFSFGRSRSTFFFNRGCRRGRRGWRPRRPFYINSLASCRRNFLATDVRFFSSFSFRTFWMGRGRHSRSARWGSGSHSMASEAAWSLHGLFFLRLWSGRCWLPNGSRSTDGFLHKFQFLQFFEAPQNFVLWGASGE